MLGKAKRRTYRLRSNFTGAPWQNARMCYNIVKESQSQLLIKHAYTVGILQFMYDLNGLKLH